MPQGWSDSSYDVTAGGQVFTNPTYLLVGAAGQPPFQSGWSNYGGGYPPLGFVQVGPFVYVRGAITLPGFVTSTVFTLPAGLRPLYILEFESGNVVVNPDGTVVCVGPGGGRLTLNELIWKAEQ